MAAPSTYVIGGGLLTMTWVPKPEVVAAEILKIEGNLENTLPPLLASREAAKADMRLKFLRQEDPEGDPWVEWAPSYRPIALANNIGKILQRTLALQTQAEEGYFVRPGIMYWSAPSAFYWKWHEEGTASDEILGRIFRGEGGVEEVYDPIRNVFTKRTIARGEGAGRGHALPARPFVSITEEARVEMLAIFEQWFSGAVSIGAASGFRIGGRFAKLPESHIGVKTIRTPPPVSDFPA